MNMDEGVNDLTTLTDTYLRACAETAKQIEGIDEQGQIKLMFSTIASAFGRACMNTIEPSEENLDEVLTVTVDRIREKVLAAWEMRK